MVPVVSMTRLVIPRAYMETILSPNPLKRLPPGRSRPPSRRLPVLSPWHTPLKGAT